MRTLLVLLDKEFRQFFRNPFLPKMAVAFPMMVMLVIPWITTMDVRHVGVSVVDNDRSLRGGSSGRSEPRTISGSTVSRNITALRWQRWSGAMSM